MTRFAHPAWSYLVCVLQKAVPVQFQFYLYITGKGGTLTQKEPFSWKNSMNVAFLQLHFWPRLLVFCFYFSTVYLCLSSFMCGTFVKQVQQVQQVKHIKNKGFCNFSFFRFVFVIPGTFVQELKCLENLKIKAYFLSF